MTAAAHDLAAPDPFAGLMGAHRGQLPPPLTRNDDRGHRAADQLIDTGELTSMVESLWALRSIRNRRKLPACLDDPGHPAARVAAAASALYPDIVSERCRYHLTRPDADGVMPTLGDTYERTTAHILKDWGYQESLSASEKTLLLAPAHPDVPGTLATLDRRDLKKRSLTEAVLHDAIVSGRTEPFRHRLAHILADRLLWGSDPLHNLASIDLNVSSPLDTRCSKLIRQGIHTDTIDEELPQLDWVTIVHQAMEGDSLPGNWPVDAGSALESSQFADKIARGAARALRNRLAPPEPLPLEDPKATKFYCPTCS